MRDENPEVSIYVHGDSALVVGPPTALDDLMIQLRPSAVEPGVPPGRLLDVLTALTGVAAVAGEHGGRWVKLTDDSQKWLDALGAVPGPDGSLLGVVRGDHGQFAHVLSFTASHADPSMLADLHTFGATLALRLAIARLEKAIQRLEGKVDELLADNRANRVAGIAGPTRTLQAVYVAYQQCGAVSNLNWDKVQSLPSLMNTALVRCTEQLRGFTRQLEDKSLSRLSRTSTSMTGPEGLATWLAMLALIQRNILMLHQLEIARVAATEPHHAVLHQAAAQKAITELSGAVREATTQLHEALLQASSISDWDNAGHPLRAKRFHTEVLDSVEVLERFMTIQIDDTIRLVRPSRRPWRDSAVEVLQDTKDVARRAAPRVLLPPGHVAVLAVKAVLRLRSRGARISARHDDGPTASVVRVDR